MKMDAARFYALLRFEEASLALRAVMRMRLVDEIGNDNLSHSALREKFGFTEQAARTFFALLQVMEILQHTEDGHCITPLAAECLADGVASSRKPYLSMGTGDDVDAFIDLLRGKHPDDALPLYSGEDAGETVMDNTDVARGIAIGLSSRARNFAQPLAAAVATKAASAKTLADVGAGSPYVARDCLNAMPELQKVMLVDRVNGMQFAREIMDTERIDASRIEFHEGDFFNAVPKADVYVLSNTAHDWRPPEYSVIIDNINASMPEDGLICIHEPILMTAWKNDSEWLHALWMACYAQTLLRFTLGEGTCYRLEEHHAILGKAGFDPLGSPVPTSDGCTALFYQRADRREN